MATGYQGYQGYAGYGDPQRAQLDRKRQIAELLQQGATDTSPKSFWEGAAQLGKAFIARGANERADQAESAYATDKARRLAQILNPNADEQGRNMAPDVNVSADPAPAPAQANPNIRSIAAALGGVYEGDGKTQPMGMTAAPMADVGVAPAPPPGGQMPSAPTQGENIKALATTLAPNETGMPGPGQISMAEPVSMPMTAAQMPKAGPDRAALMQQALRYTNGDFQQAAAIVEAKLGPAPKPTEYSAVQFGNKGLGAFDTSTGTVKTLFEPMPEPKKAPSTAIDGTMQWNEDTGAWEEIPGARAAYLALHPKDPTAGSASYRPATEQDKLDRGIDPKVPGQINTRTNQFEVISGANQTPKPTPMQVAFDKNYASELVDWQTQGSVNFQKNAAQIRSAIAILDGGKEDISGPMSMIPGRSIWGARGKEVQQQVEEVVQTSLKQILGGSFTQKEGEGILARTFDPTQEEAVNSARAKRLLAQMELGAQQKNDALNYYNENGTMAGYQGHIPTKEDFENAVSSMTPEKILGAKKFVNEVWPTLSAAAKASAQGQQSYKMARQMLGESVSPAPASAQTQAAPKQPTKYQPGAIEVDDETGQKFRFKGGNDQDPANWEPVR